MMLSSVRIKLIHVIEGMPMPLQTRRRDASTLTKICTLVSFSVGGQRLAARIEEVGGVWPWSTPTFVPSRTAYVNAIVRHGKDMLPVFDLAGKLNVAVEGPALFCLIARHDKGPLAICIDGEVPSVHNVEETSIKRVSSGNEEMNETCQLGTDEIPIYSFKRIGAGQD